MALFLFQTYVQVVADNQASISVSVSVTVSTYDSVVGADVAVAAVL